MKDLNLKDYINWAILALGFAMQWGVVTTKVNAMQAKIDSVAEIQGDLKLLKEISLDSRQRIVRIENRLIRASP